MKTILLWDPRFPDRRPARLTVEDTVASAAVRAGVAAAANPAEAGALSAGGALDPTMLTEVVLQHGNGGATRRVFLPYSVVMVGALAGVLAAIGTPIAGGVTPAPSPTPTPTPSPGIYKAIDFFGQNFASDQKQYFGIGWPFLNRAKSSRDWYTNQSGAPAPTLNSRGFPSAFAAGYTTASTIQNVEGPYGPADKKTYVIETTNMGNVVVTGASTTVSSGPGGVGQRIEFTGTGQMFDPSVGYGVYISIDKSFASNDTWNIYRKDEETAFRTGKIWRQQFIDRVKNYGILRAMDWVHTNNNNIVDFPELTKLDYTSWAREVPLEALVALANEANVTPWFNIMPKANNAFVASYVAYIEANLRPNLRYILELANEPWNTAPGFNETFEFFNKLYDSAPKFPNAGSFPYSQNYGYRSAEVMGIAQRASGYSGRCLSYFGTQDNFANVTTNTLEGIKLKLSEWRAVGGPSYDADFAARFEFAGQLYWGGGGAIYTDGDLNSSNLSPSDLATIQNWQDTNNVAAALQQSKSGGLLNSQPVGERRFLDNFPTKYAANRAIFNAEQILMVFYEGGYVFESPRSTAFADFSRSILLDTRTATHIQNLGQAAVNAGYAAGCLFTDSGSGDIAGGVYGAIFNPYTADLPRQVGLLAANAGGITYPDMVISFVAGGGYTVGASPTTTIKVVGGRGKITVTVTGLAGGRTFNGFRQIRGAFTTQQNVTATITATDERGNVATLQMPQNVGAMAVGKRYFRLRAIGPVSRPTDQPYATNGINPSLSEVAFKEADGSTILLTGVTTSGDQFSNGEGTANLIDGSTTTVWTGPANKENAVVFDFGSGAAAKPASILMTDRSDTTDRAPGDFAWEWSDDGSTWVQIYRTIMRGGTTPGNAVYNTNTFGGAYTANQFTANMTYSA